MKNFTLLFFFLLFTVTVAAQNEVKSRVILIGDAAELNTAQQETLNSASKQVITGKTTVLFLGDNVYPKGMGLPGSQEEQLTQQILQSQFRPMRKMGAAVYFIPGNRDWDNSGPEGLAKIVRQGEYLAEQNDSLLSMLPAGGCPDPVAIKVNDHLTIIAFDSEWWLYPYNKLNPEAECDCKTKDDVIARLQDLLEENRGKVILLADHHPLQSYGAHGGTSLIRSVFLNPEDLKHPFYKEMIKKVAGVFSAYPNLTYVSGHDHGLQLIKSEQLGLQIVSGGGSKTSVNKKGKNSVFQHASQGYVIADLLQNNDMRYEFYAYTPTGVSKVYTYVKPYVAVSSQPQRTVKVITKDSITIKIYPKYDSVSKTHRFFFGENYRKEYALETKVPVIRISEIKGGLTPIKRGGGFQSHSLRMVDKQGKEWVLRSVEKYPESLLPENLRETFVKDILKDNMSAQHPFSALIVPEIAAAVGVPHSEPIIGWISPDVNLGKYASIFENTLCLIEEREPLGKSDNTIKMFKKLVSDNDHTYNGPEMLKAKTLDALIGDWDRHSDQWRWKAEKEGKKTIYSPVPRDRDQVFYLTQGVFPRYAQGTTLLPMIQGYERNIADINWFVWESRGIDTRFLSQLTEKEWMDIVHEFCAAVTDEVFEKALKKIPEPGYSLRHNQLMAQLKLRRAELPKMMNEYYHFLNKTIDILGSNKGELISITDTAGKGLTVTISKLTKEKKVKEQLFKKTFDPEITKEIRLYTKAGNDSVFLDNKQSPIKLRIVGGSGIKAYHVENSYQKVKLYDKTDSASFTGDQSRFKTTLSNDTANLSYLQTDLYKRRMYFITGGFNVDDGVLLGATAKFINPGFRKFPYGNTQQFAFLHSFSTQAFRFNYQGDWMRVIGKADFLLQFNAYAPDNTQNFFGLGNETSYDKSAEGGIKYYRARFSLYQLDPAVRWKTSKSSFSVGPSLQYYRYNREDNNGRFITDPSQLHSSDSLTISKDKLYTGLVLNFVNNRRNNQVLPSLGSYTAIKLVGYTGLNTASNTYAQLTGSAAIYKNLDSRSNFVIAERIGGAATVGKPAFYQAAFLGGEGTLLGFRQFRYAGDYSLYNNLELRIKLADFVSYVAPGQFGVLGFHDIGRVWKRGESSTKWHNSVGGGIYFAPASMAVLRVVAAHSDEGWYPYISLGFRY